MCDSVNCIYVRICLSVYLFVCLSLCLSGLIQLIIRKHIKVVSIDGLLALLAACRRQICYFHYFMYLSIFLFVENSSSSCSSFMRRTMLPEL